MMMMIMMTIRSHQKLPLPRTFRKYLTYDSLKIWARDICLI